MNRKESLDFLQNCIEKVKCSTEKDIALYKECYVKNCSDFLYSDEFDFIIPTKNMNCNYTFENEISINVPSKKSLNGQDSYYHIVGYNNEKQMVNVIQVCAA